jgi:hypothetical protein
MLTKNKQKMFYSVHNKNGEKIPIYETDDEGNIQYTTVDGEKIPIEIGTKTIEYGEPIQFLASITNKLNEAVWQSYGIDNSANYAQITTAKGMLPLTIGSLIWKQTEVGYEDDEHTEIDTTTADYTVKGIADEGLAVDLFLLQRNVK